MKAKEFHEGIQLATLFVTVTDLAFSMRFCDRWYPILCLKSVHSWCFICRGLIHGTVCICSFRPFDRKRRADDQPRDQMHDPRTRDIRGLKEPRITSPVTHFSPSAEKNPSYSVPPCDGPMFSSPVTNTSPQDQVSQPPPHWWHTSQVMCFCRGKDLYAVDHCWYTWDGTCLRSHLRTSQKGSGRNLAWLEQIVEKPRLD